MSQAARFRASVLSTNLFKSTTLGVSNYWGWGSGSRLSGGFTVNVFRMVFKGFHRVVLFGREVLEISMQGSVIMDPAISDSVSGCLCLLLFATRMGQAGRLPVPSTPSPKP